MIKCQPLTKKREKIFNLIATYLKISEITHSGSNSKAMLSSGETMQ
jgi:ribosome-associated protein YbcJ (S4-like RNA binding protein)